jgi:hypothetical protein
MVVQVLSKKGQPRSRFIAPSRVLGDGLFERVRNTSLIVLGFTAAVGLGLVGFVSQQGWPLIPGSPIPGIGANREAIGDAIVAATANAKGGTALRGAAGRRGAAASARPPRRGAGGTTAPASSRPSEPQATVVSHSTPASPPHGSSPAAPTPVPAAQGPTGTPAPAPPASPSEPVAPPSPAPPPTPESAASAPQPPPSVLASDDKGEHGHGRHLASGGGHGYGHSRSGDSSDAPQSKEKPEPVPSPPVTPPAGAETPETSEQPESGKSYAPSWSHDGHGYGHDRGHHGSW